MAPSILAFPNKINDLGDFRGGVKVARDFASRASVCSPAALSAMPIISSFILVGDHGTWGPHALSGCAYGIRDATGWEEDAYDVGRAGLRRLRDVAQQLVEASGVFVIRRLGRPLLQPFWCWIASWPWQPPPGWVRFSVSDDLQRAGRALVADSGRATSGLQRAEFRRPCPNVSSGRKATSRQVGRLPEPKGRRLRLNKCGRRQTDLRARRPICQICHPCTRLTNVG